MGSVAVIIRQTRVVVDKVPPVNIIDVAIAIVIDSIGGFVPTHRIFSRFTRVFPQVVFYVLVVDVNARIDDGDNNISASR